MSDGLQFDLNYTYSKSIDIGSNAERINHFQGSGFASQVLNSWFPNQLRGFRILTIRTSSTLTGSINCPSAKRQALCRRREIGSSTLYWWMDCLRPLALD